MGDINIDLVVKCLGGWFIFAVVLGFIDILISGHLYILWGLKMLYTLVTIPLIIITGYYLLTKKREKLFGSIRKIIRGKKILDNKWLFILLGGLFGAAHNSIIHYSSKINIYELIFIGIVAAAGSYYFYLKVFPKTDKSLRKNNLIKNVLKTKWTGAISGGLLGFVFGVIILPYWKVPLISNLLIGACVAWYSISRQENYSGSGFNSQSNRKYSHPYNSHDYNSQSHPYESNSDSRSYTTNSGATEETQEKEFMTALLKLFAYVSRANDTVKSSEVESVKKYVKNQFSLDEAQRLMYRYKEILQKKNDDIQDITKKIRTNLEYSERVEMLHVLFDIAGADDVYSKPEMNAIRKISDLLRVSEDDYQSIHSMFCKEGSDLDQAYEILGVSPEASDKKVKQVYHDLATKYHPDKVENLGEELQSVAEEKFKAVNDAYKKIKEARNIT